MSARLKSWLRKAPQPVAVLCDDKRVEVPKTGRPWIELATTIASLAPSKIQALGPSGEILRAKIMEAGEEDAEGEDVVAPKGASDVQLFATLIADAYDKSGKNFAPLLDSAMAFIARQQEALTRLEREIERLRTHNHKLQAELIAASVPEGDEGEQPSMVEALAQGFLASRAGAPQPPAALQRPPQPRRDKSVPTKGQISHANGRKVPTP
jgi:hypothetical protein